MPTGVPALPSLQLSPAVWRPLRGLMTASPLRPCIRYPALRARDNDSGGFQIVLHCLVTNGLIGADWASDRRSGSGGWTAGLALGHSAGTGGYRGATGSRGIEATLSGLYPYAGLDLSEHLAPWAMAGYGTGEVTATASRWR